MAVYILENNLRDYLGHFYNMALGLKQALTQAGVDSLVAVHQDATPEVIQSLSAKPLFSQLSWASSKKVPPAKALELQGKRYRDALIQLPTPQQKDWFVVTTALQNQIFGMATYLEMLPVAQRPCTALYIHWANWQDNPSLMEAWKTACQRLAAAAGPGRFVFAVQTKELQEAFYKMTGYPAALWPVPMSYGTRQQPLARLAGPARVAVLGRCLKRKGSNLLPEILARVKYRQSQTQFTVQVSSNMPYLKALGLIPGVKVTHGGSDQAQHLNAIRQADIVLLPYKVADYCDRSSGLMMEAAALGKSVVVPRGTWLSQQIESGRAVGTTFQHQNPAQIAQAVIEAVEQLPVSSLQASQCADYWWEQQSCTAFVNSLLAHSHVSIEDTGIDIKAFVPAEVSEQMQFSMT